MLKVLAFNVNLMLVIFATFECRFHPPAAILAHLWHKDRGLSHPLSHPCAGLMIEPCSALRIKPSL